MAVFSQNFGSHLFSVKNHAIKISDKILPFDFIVAAIQVLKSEIELRCTFSIDKRNLFIFVSEVINGYDTHSGTYVCEYIKVTQFVKEALSII